YLSIDNANQTNTFILKKSTVTTIEKVKFAKPGNYVINYSTTPGVVQVYGDYTVSGSTFTLDYATNTYAATATSPKAMRGASTAVVTSTSDANAVSQLITLTYNQTGNNDWDVNGSSSGYMGHIASGSSQNIP